MISIGVNMMIITCALHHKRMDVPSGVKSSIKNSYGVIRKNSNMITPLSTCILVRLLHNRVSHITTDMFHLSITKDIYLMVILHQIRQ